MKPILFIKDWLKERSDKQFELFEYGLGAKRLKDEILFWKGQIVGYNKPIWKDHEFYILSFSSDNIHVQIRPTDRTSSGFVKINDLTKT